MNILITGGLGHIGSGLIEPLSRLKHINIRNIYVLDNFLTQRYCSLFNNKFKKIKFYEVNILKDNIEYFFKNFKISYVVHLAAITDATNSFIIGNDLFKNNLGSTKIISRLCERFNVKMIFISSTSIYGKNNSIVDEKTEKKFLKPQSPYAKIKIIEENLLKKNKNKLKYNTFRFGTIAGVSKGIRFHTAVNKFCLNASLDNKIHVYKTALHQFRPYLSIVDSFQTFKFTIEKNFFQNDIFNVLTGNYTVNQILNKIRKFKKNISIDYVNAPIMNQLSYHVDDRKIKHHGLKLKGSIEKDIKDTLKLLQNLKR